VFERVVFR